MSNHSLRRASMVALLALLPACTVAAPAADTENPVRVNQLGLLPDGPKRAVIADASSAPLPWQLLDASGKVVASGQTLVHGADATSGDHVHVVDFSSVRQPGKDYRLVVGKAKSRPITIAADVYSRLPYDALAYFYHNRSSVPIEAKYVRDPKWARPAGHPSEKVTCFSGKDQDGNTWPGCDYTLDVTGGWYDAGDHGKYVVNGGITVWTLLNAYERQQLRGAASLFADGKASIPEAGNGVNDLLDEVRYEMEFLLRMQVPEGKQARVPVNVKRSSGSLTFTTIDASGMAHHKMSDEKWTSLPMRPDQDPERRVLFPPSTSATLNLAATAAQCARIWKDIDPAFSKRCLDSAERAYAAAMRNPNVYAIGNFAGSGGYGDGELSDEFFWAAAELFITTGKADYKQALKASPHFRSTDTKEPNWGSVAKLGTVSLAVVPNTLGKDDVAALRAQIIKAADAYLADAKKEGYGLPYSTMNWPWGSTSSILNRAMLLALAHDFTGDARYRDGVTAAMDYILGRNPLDRSFVSGYGARPMQNPHHRFWANQLDPKFPPPPPGALSGGPNSTAMSDEIAQALKGKCAPQKCWADDTRSYALNEVAINWNAPLVWVAAYLNEGR